MSAASSMSARSATAPAPSDGGDRRTRVRLLRDASNASSVTRTKTTHVSGTSLAECLGTSVLRSVAELATDRVLWGQRVPGRRTGRRRFPRVTFYGAQLLRMEGGLLGHRHDRGEMATVLSGRLFVGMGEEIYALRPGDWCLCRPEIPHGECCAGPRVPYRLLWFIPHAGTLHLHVTAYQPGRGYGVTDHANVASAEPGLAELLETLCREPQAPLAQVRLRLLQLLAGILSGLTPAGGSTPPAPHPVVLAVRQALESALITPPSVAQLARSLKVTPNYLSTLFHRECGQTLRRYVETRRVEAACARLRQTTEPVKTIAYALGFADAQHFAHVFRRIMGTTPSLYRGTAVEIQTRHR